MNSTIFMIIGFTLLILYMAIVSIRYLKNSKRKKYVNKNGRIYNEDAMADSIRKFNDSNISTSFIGEIGHPETISNETIVQPVMTIQKVKRSRRSKIFRRRMNKDVKRVMDALDSPNTIIVNSGSVYKDNISFICEINKDNK